MINERLHDLKQSLSDNKNVDFNSHVRIKLAYPKGKTYLQEHVTRFSNPHVALTNSLNDACAASFSATQCQSLHTFALVSYSMSLSLH